MLTREGLPLSPVAGPTCVRCPSDASTRGQEPSPGAPRRQPSDPESDCKSQKALASSLSGELWTVRKGLRPVHLGNVGLGAGKASEFRKLTSPLKAEVPALMPATRAIGRGGWHREASGSNPVTTGNRLAGEAGRGYNSAHGGRRPVHLGSVGLVGRRPNVRHAGFGRAYAAPIGGPPDLGCRVLCRPLTVGLAVGTALLASGAARASSLASQLDRFLEANTGLTAAQTMGGGPVPNLDTAVPVLQRLVIRGADFPVTSTSPGFSFRFNFEAGMFESVTSSLGPTFVDRAETLGARRFDASATYLFARLTEVRGKDLNSTGDDLASVFSGLFSFTSGPPGVSVDHSFFISEFALEQNILNLSATYGLTDRWDVNLLAPILDTRLVVRGRSDLCHPNCDAPVGPISSHAAALDADHVGLGDVQLRTKYRFADAFGFKLAGGFALRFPTGDQDNFQGTGDFTMTPSLIVSREIRRSDVHLSLGAEVNTQNVDQSRARYAAGVTLGLTDRAAALFDFIGNSSFVADEFELTTPAAEGLATPGAGFPGVREPVTGKCGPTTCTQFLFVPRTDLLDLAMGFKFLVIPGRLIAHLGVIKPLNGDGLRAEVIPTVTVEGAF